MQRVDFRSVESSLLNSHLTYMVGTPSLILRPSAMVAPPFIPKCITPKCLAPWNEREAILMTTVGILPLSYFDRRWWTLLPSSPSALHHNVLAHRNEGEATPTTIVGILPLSHFDHRWWSLLPLFLSALHHNVLAHGNEGESTPTTTVGILPLSYIYGRHSPSLKVRQGDETDRKSTRCTYRAMT